jgi:GTP-binding protein Era
MAETQCGFIALLGAPNAGKSTLLNALTGNKVSIVSAKPQTTRTRVLGICMAGSAQLIFTDLPGVFKPKRKLDQAMVEVAWGSAQDADIVLVLIDASLPKLARESEAILAWLTEQKRKAILVLNKTDRTPKPSLLALAQELNKSGHFTDTLMISAATGDGVADLRAMVASRLPQGPWHYPEDQLTDMPERLWAAEITREQAFRQLEQELPYQIAVETELWEERNANLTAVSQVIFVQRDTQKAIVLGKGGARIKAIGTAARLEMEKELERKIHLTIHVKVKEGWTEDSNFLRSQGLLER